MSLPIPKAGVWQDEREFTSRNEVTRSTLTYSVVFAQAEHTGKEFVNLNHFSFSLCFAWAGARTKKRRNKLPRHAASLITRVPRINMTAISDRRLNTKVIFDTEASLEDGRGAPPHHPLDQCKACRGSGFQERGKADERYCDCRYRTNLL